MRIRAHLLTALLTAAAMPAFAQNGDLDRRFGHSAHGTAFDAGLRSRPWKMEGVGDVHFEVTTSVPEVQEWFDQGLALLHGYWWEEAERTFRWCAALDPECAMAYWGMAAAGLNTQQISGRRNSRFTDFLKIAIEKQDAASRRERMVIQAFENAVLNQSGNIVSNLVDGLERASRAFPDELEIKALIAAYGYNRMENEEASRYIEEILAVAPDHPGAHHHMIHNWDGNDELRALDSCAVLGDIAYNVGHLNHMPGHAYSNVGMWKEAARAMDAATRVELKYMQERLKLPFETWNYAHNRNYLCYIQENLGMASAAIQGARDLLNAPLDPDENRESGFGPHGQGNRALERALLAFERWEELLEFADGNGGNERTRMGRAFHRLQAYAGLGNARAAEEQYAEFKRLHEEVYGEREDRTTRPHIAEASLALARGDLAAQELHLRAAEEIDSRARTRGSFANDPPGVTYPAAITLADNLLAQGKYQEAIRFAEDALTMLKGNGFSYSILAQAHHALGNAEEARKYAGHLNYVWSNADRDLRWWQAVQHLGIDAEPTADTPRPERQYGINTLADIGPIKYEPFPAPELEVRDKDGNRVRLSDFQGQNVLLVYYLSDECVHCMEQLQAVGERIGEFKQLDTVVLGVSSATPDAISESLKLGALPFTMLSDSADHANARRYDSYDDFEDMELHSTFLIDRQGRVRWKRAGGDPFMNIDFLIEELERIEGR